MEMSLWADVDNYIRPTINLPDNLNLFACPASQPMDIAHGITADEVSVEVTRPPVTAMELIDDFLAE